MTAPDCQSLVRCPVIPAVSELHARVRRCAGKDNHVQLWPVTGVLATSLLTVTLAMLAQGFQK